MKVKELIKLLQSLDQDRDIFLYDKGYCYSLEVRESFFTENLPKDIHPYTIVAKETKSDLL